MPIEYTIIISVVSVTCTMLGVSIGMSNLRRLQKTDDQREGASIAAMVTTLKHIEESLSSVEKELKDSLREIKSELRDQHGRLVRNEESVKTAHKRIDELVGRRASGGET